VASVDRINVALGGVGVQPEHPGEVHRVAGAGGGGLLEDAVPAEPGQGGVPAGDSLADPPGADRAVLECAQLREQQVPVGRERPAPGAVGQVAGDRVPGELVQGRRCPATVRARRSRSMSSRVRPAMVVPGTQWPVDSYRCSCWPASTRLRPRGERRRPARPGARAGPRRSGRARV
jgi:hypothetical protein